MILKYLQIWCKYLRFKEGCIFSSFLLCQSRGLRTTWTYAPKYVTLLARGSMICTAEKRNHVENKLEFIIFDFKLCITLRHPNDRDVFLQHSPFQPNAILPHHLRKLIIKFCGPIGRKMKQRNNNIYGFWMFLNMSRSEDGGRFYHCLVRKKHLYKWLVAHVHKLTRINVSKVGCGLWPPCDFNNSGSMARIFSWTKSKRDEKVIKREKNFDQKPPKIAV